MDEMLERANKVYDEIQQTENIEKGNVGRYVAIDVDSKRYFIGETRDEAVQRGKEALPEVVFFVKRIGGEDTVSRNYPLPHPSNFAHARFL